MNGVVIVDKPAGRTSHRVVQDVRRVLGIRKAGHTGTLDPLATGVLPVCLGEATKLAPFLMEGIKEYRTTLLLGTTTDTMDREGRILSSREVYASTGDIEEVIPRFIGRIRQVPPVYSAIKLQGEPLYRRARRGEVVSSPPRWVDIFRLDVEDVRLPYLTLRVTCSKGTYIRSLCSDIGDALGCGACLTELRRLRNGSFAEGNSVSLEGMSPEEARKVLLEAMIPMAEALGIGIRAVSVEPDEVRRIRDGGQPRVDTFRGVDITFLAPGDMIKVLNVQGELVAVAKMLLSSERLLTEKGDVQAAKLLRVFLPSSIDRNQ
ncbi:MAG: tRNA pseudouridine(55) synthase TruB [Deltaproteobacteria bacterium HGW-Deltaproteobacteria-19]|jgi:tRNA pseudouridine55 synthase|nr:MAG: tRNA pseudouridine(55) synthase TruB [Deltaproteobacteria bacterium HGW-Deltaproteobacteria-19]